MQFQSQKNGLIDTKIYFLAQGRLNQEINAEQLTGVIRIMDSSNIATIIGKFNKGICDNASIYSLNTQAIKNISVQIKSSQSVWLGGPKVEEYLTGQLLFKGGYESYQRSGYGKLIQFAKGKFYEHHGEWEGKKQKGKFIKQLEQEEASELNFIEYDTSGWIQTKISQANGCYRKIVRNYQGIISNDTISQQDHQILLKENADFKKSLILAHQNATFLSPITNKSLKWVRFDKLQIQTALTEKLSYDLCEVYLQNLFHQFQYHARKRTAVLSINLMDLLQQKRRNISVNKKIAHMMTPFQKQFSIVGDFWQRVVVPLVLTNINSHYSFIVVDFNPIKCTYYDSATFSYARLYQELIKDFLNSQYTKLGKDMGTVEFSHYVAMPEQTDSVSCGFYMLEGIEEIMKDDKITFQSNQMSKIKKKILAKLSEFIQ